MVFPFHLLLKYFFRKEEALNYYVLIKCDGTIKISARITNRKTDKMR